MARFYITTSIMYANASPHVGFAMELIQGDVLARYRRMMGDDVMFLTGTDEHGTKIMRAAQQADREPQELVDDVAGKVLELTKLLNISNTDFIRTSDRIRHWPAAQKLWRKLQESGDLYKKSYEGYYCVGHEAFIKRGELIDGLCPDHRSKPELIMEENWFFRLTSYRDRVRDMIEGDRIRIVPARRKAEMLNLLKDAEDVSFSRPSGQLPWGIAVPDDPAQTMYVWADALTNYISALGYGATGTPPVQGESPYERFWPADVHLVGKDIVRFHAILWPAMLLSAGLDTPKSIYVHGFITVDGQKMSKTVGNIVDPFQVIKKWPADVVRYFMLREIPSDDDGDFSWKSIENRYNADLANGLGNLVQRTAKLAEGTAIRCEGRPFTSDVKGRPSPGGGDENYHKAIEEFRLHEALGYVWQLIGEANGYLNEREPWKQDGDARVQTLTTTVAMIRHIAELLAPFMPSTSERVSDIFTGDVKVPEIPLFPRE